MTAKILDGNVVAAQIRQSIANEITIRSAKGLKLPSLAVILVGNNPASEIYVKHKRKDCQSVGIISHAYDLPPSTTHNALLELIAQLNADEDIHGILVQLPLPLHIRTSQILDAIDPNKDVDAFHPYNVGCLAQRRPTLRPCTPFGIITLLKNAKINLEGINAVVLGSSNIVGRPMALELLLAKATVTVCHRFSKETDIAGHVKRADLLVVAIGKLGVIKTEWIKPRAIVVDVGIHRLPDGSICGDVDFASAKLKASWITPVPGGVGPMTRAILLQNTLYAAERQSTATIS